MIVPAGSGNDFARALNLHSPRHSLAAWQQFVATGQNLQTIDLGTITPLNQYPRNSSLLLRCGMWLDAEVARRANALPRWMRAHGGYALSVPAALLSYKTPNIKLSIADDRETYVVCRDQPTLMTAFANVPAYGDGMKIAPEPRSTTVNSTSAVSTRSAEPSSCACFQPSILESIWEFPKFTTSRQRD